MSHTGYEYLGEQGEQVIVLQGMMIVMIGVMRRVIGVIGVMRVIRGG